MIRAGDINDHTVQHPIQEEDPELTRRDGRLVRRVFQG